MKEIKKIVTVILVISIIMLLVGVLAFIAFDIALQRNPIVIEGEADLPAIIRAMNPHIVKAGQIWEPDDDQEDPFRKKNSLRKRVVAVKDGYVKWYFVGQEDYGEWASQSDTARYFVEFYHLVKESEGVNR